MTENPAIAFVVPFVSRRGGGIVTSAQRLAQILAEKNAVDVFGLDDEFAREDIAQWFPVQPQILSTRGPRSFGYAPGLRAALNQSPAELIHNHGIWAFTSATVRRAGKPYLITPHGMLDPWALNHSRAKKRVAALLFENSHLRDAVCLHALCEAEAKAIRAYGLANPICIIPNGVDLPASPVAADPPWKEKFSANEKCALYLGRLHLKKNLANLLRAWKQSAPREWALVIAGWDQNGHEAELKRIAHELGIESRVHFTGPLFGEAKTAAYQNADAFILPSVSEGLPMVVLEAWSHRLPVVMTAECNLPEGFAASAAIHITTDVTGISRGLMELFGESIKERKEMGLRGYELVQQRFSWREIGHEMGAVYQWILNRGPQPESIFSQAE